MNCEHAWKEVSGDEVGMIFMRLTPPPVNLQRVLLCERCNRPAVEVITDDGERLRGIYRDRLAAAYGVGPYEWVRAA